jgi:hypothetical protein
MKNWRAFPGGDSVMVYMLRSSGLEIPGTCEISAPLPWFIAEPDMNYCYARCHRIMLFSYKQPRIFCYVICASTGCRLKGLLAPHHNLPDCSEPIRTLVKSSLTLQRCEDQQPITSQLVPPRLQAFHYSSTLPSSACIPRYLPTRLNPLPSSAFPKGHQAFEVPRPQSLDNLACILTMHWRRLHPAQPA